MKDILFHLRNEGLEGVKGFVMVFIHIKRQFIVFTYMVHCKWSDVIHDIALRR